MSARSDARDRLAPALLLVAALVVLLTPLVLASCGGNADLFSGVYWEPSTGRRIEIKQEDDAYRLYYGRDKQSFRATRDGDQLVITDPMGGQSIVRPGDAEGTLQLVSGGKTTVLKPLPEHQ